MKPSAKSGSIQTVVRAATVLVCSVSGAGQVEAMRFDAGLPQEGQWRNGLAVADMNADGHPDIVHGPPRKGSPSPVIFLGNSEGQWERWTTSFPDLAYAYGDVAVADFDGDGHQDVALAMHRRGIAVFRGDSTGTFRPWSAGLPWLEGDTAEGFTSRCIEAVDWNGDGSMDLVAAWEGFDRLTLSAAAPRRANHGVSVFLNEGDGTWRALLGMDKADGTFGDGLAVVDLDGDGRTDFVMASRQLNPSLVGGLGRGTDGWQALHAAGLPAQTYITGVCALGEASNGVLLARLTHDGRRFEAAIDRMALDKRGAIQRTPVLTLDASAVTAMACGDVDGDRFADVALGHDDGSIRLLHGDGAGGWRPLETTEPLGGEGRCYSVTLEDVDGDGRAELIAGFARETQAVGALGMGTTRSGSLRVWILQVRPDMAADSADQHQAAPGAHAQAVLAGAHE